MRIKRGLAGLCVLLCAFAAPLQADILIGFAGPLTGPRAWSGQQFQRGAEQAVADINTLGGVLGQRLTLVVGDDASDGAYLLLEGEAGLYFEPDDGQNQQQNQADKERDTRLFFRHCSHDVTRFSRGWF